MRKGKRRIYNQIDTASMMTEQEGRRIHSRFDIAFTTTQQEER
jgi:hypothetical protein